MDNNTRFRLGPIWKSGTPPTTGMNVDVEFEADGSLASITQVNESQVAREQAEAVMNAKKRSRRKYHHCRLVAKLRRRF